eukprot:365202-Chlamydomonas_euryale.AAC.10
MLRICGAALKKALARMQRCRTEGVWVVRNASRAFLTPHTTETLIRVARAATASPLRLCQKGVRPGAGRRRHGRARKLPTRSPRRPRESTRHPRRASTSAAPSRRCLGYA